MDEAEQSALHTHTHTPTHTHTSIWHNRLCVDGIIFLICVLFIIYSSLSLE